MEDVGQTSPVGPSYRPQPSPAVPKKPQDQEGALILCVLRVDGGIPG